MYFLLNRNERHRLVRQQTNVIGSVFSFDGNKIFLPFQLPEPVSHIVVSIGLLFMSFLFHCSIIIQNTNCVATFKIPLNVDFYKQSHIFISTTDYLLFLKVRSK